MSMHHPTDFVHGLLSAHVYKTYQAAGKEGDSVNYKGVDCKNWRIHKIYGKSTNYYGVLYVNNTDKQAVLAYSSVDVTSPLKVASKVLHSSQKDHKEFVRAITQDAINIASNEKYHFSLTGHALGGWLAQLGAYFCYKNFNYDVINNIKSVTFDNPGIARQIENDKPNVNNAEATDISEVLSLSAVTYLSAPNLINICDKHLGKVYILFPEFPKTQPVRKFSWVNFQKFIFKKQICQIYGVADIDLLLTAFNHEVGTPYPQRYRKVLNWPCISLSGDYGSQTKKLVKETLEARGVPKTIASLLSKFIPSSPLTDLIVGFFTGNLNLDQPTEQEFLSKYIDDHEVNLNEDIISSRKGTPEWYLMKLTKCDERDIRSLAESAAKELLDLRKEYSIEVPNHIGMRVIKSDSCIIEELKDHMRDLLSNNDIEQMLGGVMSNTKIEEIILEMQEEAAEWVNTCSANNVIKEKGQSNHEFIKKIEKLVEQLREDKIQKYFESGDISLRHLLNSIYSMNALANYYLYNEHDGEKAREILLSSKKLAEKYVSNKNTVKFNFDSLNAEEIYTNFDIIKDLPEMYVSIIYLLGRTYMYHGDKSKAIPYFELSKYLGNKLNLFEGYLSEARGLAIIEIEAIDQQKPVEAIERLNEFIALYKKLKVDHTEYKEGYKPSIGESSTVIPSEDTYNQVECNEQLAKCYTQLIVLTDDETQRTKYLTELYNQFIELNRLPGALEYVDHVLPKKAASVYNTLGYSLLKLHDQNINFNHFKREISKKLLSLGESASDLDFILGIFILAKEKSRESEFTKADAYNGLSIVYGEKLRQEDYSGEEEKMRLQELKTKYETKSKEINKILDRVEPSELVAASSSQHTGITEVEQECSDQNLTGLDSTSFDSDSSC